MYSLLEEINKKPKPYEFYTAEELWTNEHTAKEMLSFHLNQEIDASSRNKRFIKSSVDWIVKKFSVTEETSIADFGCGPGLYTTLLAQHGAKMTGIDFSQNSINYAKEKAKESKLDIEYTVQNYLDFETDKKFDLILMIMCDFTALSPIQRKAMLKKFNSLLEDNGSILLDVYSLKMFEQTDESASYEKNQLNSFWSADDYFCFVNKFKYDIEKLLLDKYTIIEKSGIRQVYNWMQCFSRDTIADEFVGCGLVIEEYFDDVAGSRYTGEKTEFAVAAKKRN